MDRVTRCLWDAGRICVHCAGISNMQWTQMQHTAHGTMASTPGPLEINRMDQSLPHVSVPHYTPIRFYLTSWMSLKLWDRGTFLRINFPMLQISEDLLDASYFDIGSKIKSISEGAVECSTSTLHISSIISKPKCLTLYAAIWPQGALHYCTEFRSIKHCGYFYCDYV